MAGAIPVSISRMPRCRLCTCVLTGDDDTARLLCVDCQGRPEARRVGPTTPAAAKPAAATRTEPFNPAERALIRSTHGYMPMADLLRVLNERRTADRGAAVAVTLEQLHAELQAAADPRGGAGDWAALRKLIGQARRSGVLASATATVIDDFAICYQLAPAQVMQLRDVIRNAKED